jgi:hypothetical protein
VLVQQLRSLRPTIAHAGDAGLQRPVQSNAHFARSRRAVQTPLTVPIFVGSAMLHKQDSKAYVTPLETLPT